MFLIAQSTVQREVTKICLIQPAFLPLVQKLASTTDKNVRLLTQFVQLYIFIFTNVVLFSIYNQGKQHKGCVDLVCFDGASIVQNVGRVLQARYPRVTVGHGSEHTIALFFLDVFTKIPDFLAL